MDVCLAHNNSSGKGKNLVSSTPLPSRLVRPSPAPSVPLSSTPPPFPPLPPPTSRLPSVSGRPVPSPRSTRCRPASLCPRLPSISGRQSSNRRRRRTIWPRELQSPPSPPHDLAAGRSTCSKPQIDATSSRWATASCPRPSAMDTAARGSSTAGDGDLDAFLRPSVLPSRGLGGGGDKSTTVKRPGFPRTESRILAPRW
jgi:hypothetical protein